MADLDLEVALRDLGAHLDIPDPPELTGAVLDRLAEPRRRAWGVPARVAAAVVLVLLTLAVLVTVSPPVRAAVLNLLRFAGIELSTDAAPAGRPLPTAVPLPGERVVDLATARQQAQFEIAVPAKLGEPETVLLADGTPPRIVSLSYRGGSVRLDEFDGELDFAFYKKMVGSDGVEWTQVDGGPAIWVDRPHELVYVDPGGRHRQESARLSAKTLIWRNSDGVTLRLEGDFSVAEAIEVAESVS
ncbi:hypothetical protein [Actinophytocola sp.]|uniref:hypothetical protein n=1 Tax=Actinophytocola sp. TaxID=1872138 RepID=UPI002D80AE82|nr:hypothetical protein [Actinophytocola sp.]HET9139704.1 hypothetical protein [Actinophytocola sp.]